MRSRPTPTCPYVSNLRDMVQKTVPFVWSSVQSRTGTGTTSENDSGTAEAVPNDRWLGEPDRKAWTGGGQTDRWWSQRS